MTLAMTLLGPRRKILGLLLQAVPYHVLAVIYFPVPEDVFVDHDLDYDLAWVQKKDLGAAVVGCSLPCTCSDIFPLATGRVCGA